MIFKTSYRFLLLFGFLAASGPVEAQNTIFNQLKTRFQEGAVFSAFFTQTYTDSYTGDSQTSYGDIWIGEQSYKIKSDEKELVVNGVTSSVYDAARNRVIISNYDEEDDDFAPSRMINGADSTYTISESPAGKSNTLIILQTDDEFALFMRVEIEVNSVLIPVSIRAFDYSDNVTATSFESGKFLNNNGEWFLLNYSEDAEIIDTRY